MGEPGVAELPEGSQLVRAMGVLTGKYCMLVMKCIWKVIRGLPSWLEAGMDVSLLLADLHSFLVSYPGSYWKQQADDTPMRTVKTVIHTLVKQQGEAILGCLNRIQDPQASELVPYIRKLLNSGVGDDAPTANNNNSSHNNAVASSEKKKMPRFTKSDHEALVEIFKKIGQKELTKVGLQELFSFKQKNPHVDLEPFLAQSSQYFRDYIERGLRKIEEEGCAVPISSIGGIGGMSGIPPPRTSVLSDNTAVGGSQGSQPQHLVYLERLKKLRAAGGLSEPADQENVENFSGGVSSGVREGYNIGSGYSSGGRLPQSTVNNQRFSAAEPIDNQEENQNMAAPNVDEIRKRLAKIKAQAF